jgi:hypothetical protein
VCAVAEKLYPNPALAFLHTEKIQALQSLAK